MWQLPRTRGRLASSFAAIALTMPLGACGLSADRPAPIRAADLARELTAVSGIRLTAEEPPAGLPGLPQLATTLTGGSQGESITALVFFDSSDTATATGAAIRLAGAVVMRRDNVVVIYRAPRSRRATARQIRQVLARLAPGG